MRIAGLISAWLVIIMLASLLLTGPAEGRDLPEHLPIYTPTALPASANVDNIRHVKAGQTHSGFAVPRYVSLKYGTVNGRRGPSTRHPVLWQYQRRGMPLIVVAEMDIWRKVRDINGDEAWIRGTALSGKSMALTIGDTPIKARPNWAARDVALASPQTLLSIEACREDGWCRVKAAERHKGWVRQDTLWGAGPL